MIINAGILGHRPSKLFIITTGGRVDNFFAYIVLWVSARTWGRWTRWYPQNIVTLATALYFVFSIANLWIGGGSWGGWNGVGNVCTVLVICVVSAYLELLSWRLSGLSGRMTEVSLTEVLAARRAASTRAIFGPIVVFAAVGAAWHPDSFSITSLLTLFSFTWAVYTVTMGRTSVPPKRERRPLRLPALRKLPRLLPVPSS